MLAAGVAVGLGTDGEKENNNLDLFEEMKVASLLAKLTRLDASALDAWSVLGMATHLAPGPWGSTTSSAPSSRGRPPISSRSAPTRRG